MIRALHWWDLPQLAELEHSTYPLEPWSEESFWGDLSRGARYVVNDEDGAIDAYAGMLVREDEGYIQTVAVSPSARGKGYGASMLDVLLTTARELDLKSVGLEVATRNTAARRIYDAAGFVAVGLRKNYYPKENDDGVQMTLTL